MEQITELARFERDMDTLIRAAKPMIAVLTPEEARALMSVLGVLEGQRRAKELRGNGSGATRRRLYLWSATKGIHTHPADDMTPAVKDGGFPSMVDEWGNPVASDIVMPELDVFLSWLAARKQQTDATVWVLLDAHGELERNARLLRDVAQRLLTDSPDTVVFISPDTGETGFPIPAGMQDDVAVLRFPLPGMAELRELVEGFVEGLPNGCDVALDDIARDRLADALRGLTWRCAQDALAENVIRKEKLDEDVFSAILASKKQMIGQTPGLTYYPAQDVRVGGLDVLKGFVAQAHAAMSPEARKFGLQPPRGVYLVGPSGTGKSLTAKLIAGGIMPLVQVSIGGMMHSHLGQSEAHLRQALRVIEAIGRCVAWFDEAHLAIGGGKGGETDGQTSQRMMGELQTWLEERFETGRGVDAFVVMTGNEPLDNPAVEQRMDEVFWVGLPGPKARAEILAIHIAQTGRDPAAYDLSQPTAVGAGHSGRELAISVQKALRIAFLEQREMTEADLVAAITEKVPTSRRRAKEHQDLLAWAVSSAVDASADDPEPADAQTVVARKLDL